MIFILTQLASFIPLSGVYYQYHWSRALEKESGREEAQWEEGTWPRIHVEPVVYNDTLLMIGTSRTWKSPDGIHWKAFPHNGKWGKRYGASYTLFDGKIWVMGGMKTWDEFTNDVWLSEDGIEWTLVTNSAPWTRRRGHATLVHEGMMWLMGGAESSGRPDILPKGSLGDVWKTADGKTWKQVTSNSPWQTEFSKEYFSSTTSGLQFDGRIWIIGGPGGNGVWSSRNGLTWTQEAKHSTWPARYARGTAVFENMFWVFGGSGHNDVWYSRDGKDWELLILHAPWSPRAPGPVIVFRNRLWMFGGKTGQSNDRGDDVWYLQHNDE